MEIPKIMGTLAGKLQFSEMEMEIPGFFTRRPLADSFQIQSLPAEASPGQKDSQKFMDQGRDNASSITVSGKVNKTSVRARQSNRKNYGHLIQVPKGTNPSPEFIKNAKKAITEMMHALPEDLRNFAESRGFRVLVFQSPEDWQKIVKKEGMSEIIHPDMVAVIQKAIQDKLKASPSHYSAQMLKKKADYKTEVVLEEILLPKLAGAKAFYSQGHKSIILHETLGNLKLSKEQQGLVNQKVAPDLLLHEIGHYFDFSRGFSEQFSKDKDFRRLVQEDLKTAQANGKLAKLQGTEKSSKSTNQPLTANNLAYYTPNSDNRVTQEGQYVEAFGEIFAGLYGKGYHQECLAEELYPNAAQYLREQILPQILNLPHRKLGHNGF